MPHPLTGLVAQEGGNISRAKTVFPMQKFHIVSDFASPDKVYIVSRNNQTCSDRYLGKIYDMPSRPGDGAFETVAESWYCCKGRL